MFLEEEKAGMMVGRLKLKQFKKHQPRLQSWSNLGVGLTNEVRVEKQRRDFYCQIHRRSSCSRACTITLSLLLLFSRFIQNLWFQAIHVMVELLLLLLLFWTLFQKLPTSSKPRYLTWFPYSPTWTWKGTCFVMRVFSYWCYLVKSNLRLT
jgi:hypothetical protein